MRISSSVFIFSMSAVLALSGCGRGVGVRRAPLAKQTTPTSGPVLPAPVLNLPKGVLVGVWHSLCQTRPAKADTLVYTKDAYAFAENGAMQHQWGTYEDLDCTQPITLGNERGTYSLVEGDKHTSVVELRPSKRTLTHFSDSAAASERRDYGYDHWVTGEKRDILGRTLHGERLKSVLDKKHAEFIEESLYIRPALGSEGYTAVLFRK